MPYRGPNPKRILAQRSTIALHNSETAIWQQYVSASTGTASAYFAGLGTQRYYREQVISAMWAAPQLGEARFREFQNQAGQTIAGGAVVSTTQVLGSDDQLIWRGVTYRIEGDSTPIHIGDRVWFRTLLKRGDATG